MTSAGTNDGTGAGAGTIVGMATADGAATVDTAGILTYDGSGDLARTRDDRVVTGSGDMGSGARLTVGMVMAFDTDKRDVAGF